MLDLEAKAEKAREAARVATKEAESASLQRLMRWEQRLDEYDRKTLERYDGEALRQTTQDAREGFDKAVAEGGNAIAAWVDYVAAREVYSSEANEVANIAQKLGDERRIHVPEPRSLDFMQALEAAVDKATRQRVADEMDRRAAEREQYAEAGE